MGSEKISINCGMAVKLFASIAHQINHGMCGSSASKSRRKSILTRSMPNEPGSRLAGIVGTTELEVNSLHHQVVAVPPPGSRVVARNTDGHIEGLEFPDAARMLAVQWHPELLRHRPEHLALFQDLVATAGAERASGSTR